MQSLIINGSLSIMLSIISKEVIFVGYDGVLNGFEGHCACDTS
jgi:hypothetical protein